MLITPHATTGALVGYLTQNPILGFFAGIISHFMLDALPHTDQGTLHNYQENIRLNTKDYLILFFDIIIAIMLFLWLFQDSSYNYGLFWGVVGGIGVDVIDNCYTVILTKKTFLLKQIHWLHDKIHYKLSIRYWYAGLALEMAITILSISILIFSF